jgi:cyclopropane-fatty-acyl-phospholipid synthase
MPRGRLRIVGPDGSERCFGTGQGDPSAQIIVRNPRFFTRCVLQGDVGFGEAFVAGDWDSQDVPAVVAWFCANVEHAPSMSGTNRSDWRLNLMAWLNRIQHRGRANSQLNSKRNIREHYDLGNDFYQLWLDPSVTYSSALFEHPEQSLEAAQNAKYDRLCRNLKLQAGDHILEIGCGWGGFARHAATRYGCRVTGVTLSEAQYQFATARASQEGWSGRAEFLLQDYRTLGGKFDHIVSIEMLEAVGDEYLETFFQRVHDLLKPDGLFAAQFITCPDARHDGLRRGVDWIQKHIFPGSLILSLNRVNSAIQRTGSLWMHDLQDMGSHYARTLKHWRMAFNSRVDDVQALGFDETFVRKWNYYLSYCEAAFATRNISVIQGLWTRPNNPRLGIQLPQP